MLEEDVYRLHQMFQMVVDAIMKLNCIIDIPDVQQEYVESQSKLYKETKTAKCGLCLKQSGIFDSLTKEELLEFSSNVMLYNALQSDSIYEEEVVDHFVLIGDGKVEVSKADRDIPF